MKRKSLIAAAKAHAKAQDRVCGSQLMTAQERSEYQQRMRELRTQQERDQFRTEHHAKVRERAKERGMTLPAEPSAQGRGYEAAQWQCAGRGCWPRRREGTLTRARARPRALVSTVAPANAGPIAHC